MVKKAAKEVGKGIIYVSIPDNLQDFSEAFAKGIGWKFEEQTMSFSEMLSRKLFGAILEGILEWFSNGKD